MFLAIGALTSQLAATRRQANGLAALVIAGRLSDPAHRRRGRRRRLAALGEPARLDRGIAPADGCPADRAGAAALLVIAASGFAVLLAGRRDAGGAMLARRGPVRAHTRLLDSSALLVVRLERWVALASVGGLAMTGTIFGITGPLAAGQRRGS
jgi:polyether ionophore transport system permease protein